MNALAPDLAPVHDPDFDEDDFDMTNLFSDETGIEGVIWVSTEVGQHGPRVKYYLRAGKTQPSFSVTIGPEPRVVVSSLPQSVVNRMAPAVFAWVELNADALLDFWQHGTEWRRDRVSDFFEALKPVPR